MPTVAVNINLSSIGTDAGPFTISDNVSGVIATGISRTSLLANYVVNADDTATQITVTSTGVCTSTITIPIDFHPCGDVPPPPPPTPPTPPPPPPSDCKQNVVINVTDTGYIKYFNCTSEETEYQFISGTGNTTLTNCVDLPTIAPGIPLADLATFTIVNNGTTCGVPPTPPTPPTPTPTPPPPSCILVIEEVIAPTPQVGANNFFGAKVTLDPFPVDENVTVDGYIRDDGDITNTYTFSLTINAGNESAETANNVLMTGPADTATIFITSITPTSVTYDGDTVPICGYEPTDIIYISGLQSTCSNFCTTGDIFITTERFATSDYFNIGPFDVITDITAAGFYAIADEPTDTGAGPFKIVETDSGGVVLSVLQCSGFDCTPL
jgi:hypothetical protein